MLNGYHLGDGTIGIRRLWRLRRFGPGSRGHDSQPGEGSEDRRASGDQVGVKVIERRRDLVGIELLVAHWNEDAAQRRTPRLGADPLRLDRIRRPDDDRSARLVEFLNDNV